MKVRHVVLDLVDLAVDAGHLLLLFRTGVIKLRALAAKALRAPEVVLRAASR